MTGGAIVAVAVQQLLQPGESIYGSFGDLDVWRGSLATGLAAAGLTFGLVVDRRRPARSLAVAIGIGAMIGLILFWQGQPGWALWGNGRAAMLLVAFLIVVPLLQARAEGGGYAALHRASWNDVIECVAGGVVVAMVLRLVLSLGRRLAAVAHLLEQGWFWAVLIGGGFGLVLGLLRGRDAMLDLARRIAAVLLSVFAPLLVLFLLALPFAAALGLWWWTESPTATFLGGAILALVVANAAIGAGDADRSMSPVLRGATLVLALAVLPLAVVAGAATGMRIDQYGISPTRLWALVFVALAAAHGLAGLVAIVRGRRDWPRRVRAANITLAVGIAIVALLLATPIVSFDAISAHAQAARLEAGRVTPDRFDWAALAFDYGDAGQAAVKRLTGSADPAIAVAARKAAAASSRFDLEGPGDQS
ncbi:DUF4153 domain-containing protein [uncultured Sphingomonas sp.]|uniref:DUF4153 domain-containing protein n=1 Tax=uncultured Sphingomonas sp. TaxID=158754 RepID=UPI0035C99D6C